MITEILISDILLTSPRVKTDLNLEGFIRDIQENGLVNPIRVRLMPDYDPRGWKHPHPRFLIDDGYRRALAYLILEKVTIPAEVRTD
jgi:hypothetical protein